MIRLQSAPYWRAGATRHTAYAGDLIAGYAIAVQQALDGPYSCNAREFRRPCMSVEHAFESGQHPADGSVWMFVKKTPLRQSRALHLARLRVIFPRLDQLDLHNAGR